MAAYHRRFRHIDQRVKDATDRLFRSRPSEGTPAEQHAKLDAWLNAASRVYGIPKPTLRFTNAAEACGHGCYVPALNEIRLPYASITTLLHEFRHAMQHHGFDMVESRFDPEHDRHEEDARAWSLSLYHTVRPGLFRRMIENGRIMYVLPDDLAPRAA